MAIYLISHPILIFLIILIISTIIIYYFHSIIDEFKNKFITSWRCFVYYCSLGVLIGYLATILYYLLTPIIVDHLQPSIIANSWLFAIGQPIYHDYSSASRYSLLYGPIVYMINAFFMKSFGHSIFYSKIGGVLAAVSSIFIGYLSFCKIGPRRDAIIYTALMVAFLLMFSNFSYCPRPDPFLLFCSALSLTVSLYFSGILAAAIIGIALGVAVNMKISALFYFFPVLALFFNRQGLRYVWLAILLSISVWLIPFSNQNVSFLNMLYWIKLASNHGLSYGHFLTNLNFLLLLTLPAFFCMAYLWFFDYQTLRSMIIKEWILIAAFLSGILLTIIIASKPGAGPHHFIPFIPFTVYISAYLQEKVKKCSFQSIKIRPILWAFVISFLLSLFSLSIFTIMYTIKKYRIINYQAQEIIADLNLIIRSHPNKSIGMGVGDNFKTYHLTFYRPLLIFMGNPYLIDPGAMMDMQYAGLVTPEKTIEILKSGFFDIWLIPKSETPFYLRNYYDNKLLFDDAFRNEFVNHYKHEGASKFYDLWHYKQ